MIKGLSLLLACLGALLLFGIRPAEAWSLYEWKIRASRVILQERETSARLKVVFSLYDERVGVTALDSEPQAARVTLGAHTTSAAISRPDDPLYIALLLDSSGSMAGARDRLKTAAKQAIRAAPDNAYFAIIQFDEGVKLLQAFTQAAPALELAIDQYKVAQLGTCLYDAGYEAVEALKKIEDGRKAIILFTDGRDEKPGGSVCSQHSYNDLASLASQAQVAISTIGLAEGESRVDAAMLEGLSSVTGGISVTSSQANLSERFSTILQSLKAQWLLTAEVYPERGDNEATLEVQLKDGALLRKTVQVQSGTQYGGPPSPVAVRQDEFLPNVGAGAYDLNLTVTGGELVGYIKVMVWDKNGATVAALRFDDVHPTNTYRIPIDQLADQQEYQLIISAISRKDGTSFSISQDSQGKPVYELRSSFKHLKSKFEPSITVQNPSQAGTDLLLEVTPANGSLIQSYGGWLERSDGGMRVNGSEFTSAGLEPGSLLRIPLDREILSTGKYRAVVYIINDKGARLSPVSIEVMITLKPPTFWEKFFEGVAQNPLIPVLMSLVVVGASGSLAFVIVRGRQPKSTSGLPALDHSLKRTKTTHKASSGLFRPRKASLVCLRCPPQLVMDHKSFVVEPVPFLIGRTECNLTIASSLISRQHARISYDSQLRAYTITDLGSSNGTWVNHKSGRSKLVPHQAVTLASGSQIEIGPELIFRIDIG